jgi:hypothetical protein
MHNKIHAQQRSRSMNLPIPIKTICSFTLLAVFSLAASLSLAQSPSAGTPAPTESTRAIQETAAPSKPIVVNWTLKKLDGKVNIVVTPDGRWIFSGGFKDKKPGDDWDISIGIKSSTGAIYVFHYEGDATQGVEFSKEGSSAILEDDFSTFAHHGWSGSYNFHLSEAARRARYEAMERKREQLRKDEEEARKRKDEKLIAEKKAEEKRQAQDEVTYEQQHPGQPAPQEQGSNGKSYTDVKNEVRSTMMTATANSEITNLPNNVSNITHMLGDVGSAIASWF